MDLKRLFDDAPSGWGWYGVVGHDIPYTLSPLIHGAALKLFALPAVYRKIDIRPSDWDVFLVQARSVLGGFNITKPFKERAAVLAGTAEGLAGFLGAVNTAYRSPSWAGLNTDLEGFRRDAREQGFQFAKKRVLVIGAGGAARAVLGALVTDTAPPAHVTVMNRRVERARSLVMDLTARGLLGPASSTVSAAEVTDLRAVDEADLIVNTTPAGQNPGEEPPVPLNRLRAGQSVYDLIYHRDTDLVWTARRRGCLASGGLGMLVHQAALAFEQWFKPALEKLKYNPSDLRRAMRAAAETAQKETT